MSDEFLQRKINSIRSPAALKKDFKLGRFIRVKGLYDDLILQDEYDSTKTLGENSKFAGKTNPSAIKKVKVLDLLEEIVLEKSNIKKINSDLEKVADIVLKPEERNDIINQLRTPEYQDRLTESLRITPVGATSGAGAGAGMGKEKLEETKEREGKPEREAKAFAEEMVDELLDEAIEDLMEAKGKEEKQEAAKTIAEMLTDVRGGVDEKFESDRFKKQFEVLETFLKEEEKRETVEAPAEAVKKTSKGVRGKGQQDFKKQQKEIDRLEKYYKARFQGKPRSKLEKEAFDKSVVEVGEEAAVLDEKFETDRFKKQYEELETFLFEAEAREEGRPPPVRVVEEEEEKEEVKEEEEVREAVEEDIEEIIDLDQDPPVKVYVEDEVDRLKKDFPAGSRESIRKTILDLYKTEFPNVEAIMGRKPLPSAPAPAPPPATAPPSTAPPATAPTLPAQTPTQPKETIVPRDIQPTLLSRIPPERLGITGKSVEQLRDDIRYFFQQFPQELKTVKYSRRKKDRRYLEFIHKRIEAKLRGSQTESKKKIGIVISGEDFIKDKLKEIIMENSIQGLTAADLIINIEGKPQEKGKDAGAYEIKRGADGKASAQREPVYRFIPETQPDEEPRRGKIPTPQTRYRSKAQTAKKQFRNDPFRTKQPSIRLKYLY